MNLLLAILLLLPIPTEAATAPQLNPGRYGSDQAMNCPIEVIPGHGIGPIHLRQTRAEVKKLKMKIVPVRTLPQDEIVGRYSVHYDDKNIVQAVALSLSDAPDCVRYQGEPIPKKANAAELAKIFTECPHQQINEGGQITECKDVAISDGGAWGGVTIRIDNFPPTPPTIPAPLEQALKKFQPQNR